MNNDGQLDIVLGNKRGENEVFLLDKDGKPGESIHFSGITSHTLDVTLADLNKDGNLDILVANYGSPNEFLVNKGDMVFDHQFISNRNFETTAIFAFDINRDQIIDVVETNFEHLNLILHRTSWR